MYRVLLATMITLACAHGDQSEVRSESWCFQEREQGVREQVSNFVLYPVHAGRMADALQMLSTRTVVPLTREMATHLLGETIDAPGMVYLARASITTAPGATMEEIVDTARRDTRFDIFWSPEDRSIALFSSQTVVTDRQQNNIAVIIGIDRPVEKVYVGCFVTD